MAAKSKKRLSKIENKLIKLENLELKDVVCSICQSILVEPVTLPCFHDFCLHCFNGSIENNALCCPLCRLRIGSWVRTATKQKNLVNVELWKFIQTKFGDQIHKKAKGQDIVLPAEKPILRLSAPGEIRVEYEAELSRLRKERFQLEQKHLQETEFLIKQIQKEEEEAHKKYLEALKRDEIIAQQMQNEILGQQAPPPNSPRKLSLRSSKSRLKDTKIDGYLSKNKPTRFPPAVKESDTTDNTSTIIYTTKVPTSKPVIGGSPEMIPTYGKLVKSLIEKKNKLTPGVWDKENGDRSEEKKDNTNLSSRKTLDVDDKKNTVKLKNGLPSLVVSLPLPSSGILHQKPNILEHRKDAGSVDSMRQELCYFKPIDEVTTTSYSSTNKGLPLRVPGVRARVEAASPTYEPPPSFSQYFDSLCRLRNLSLSKNLPSAFAIALDILRIHKKGSLKCDNKSYSKAKKRKSASPFRIQQEQIRKNSNRNKQPIQTEGFYKINTNTNLRRTRSMGSISKDENETTPKKTRINKQRKAASERKPFLRSDSKRTNKELESPQFDSETINNNNKVNLAVKNLSSPLKNCDVKHIILHEQLRIEKLIEQEKNDLELARRLEAEWNERRPRRAAVKRQVTLNHTLRPAKKLKV